MFVGHFLGKLIDRLLQLDSVPLPSSPQRSTYLLPVTVRIDRNGPIFGTDPL
jgi:hypothetical protein